MPRNTTSMSGSIFESDGTYLLTEKLCSTPAAPSVPSTSRSAVFESPGVWLTFMCAMAASGCATRPISVDTVTRHDDAQDRAGRAVAATSSPATNIKVFEGPSARVVTGAGGQAVAEATTEQLARLVDGKSVQASLPPQPVPQFIDTVFGQIFEVPYVMGPGVAEMREIVSMRGPMTGERKKLVSMAQMALRNYGLALSVEDGVVHITKDELLAQQAPRVVRSRSLPESPESTRPVVQFFELQAMDANNVVALLKEIYPDAKSVKIEVRSEINSLVMIGSAQAVAAAGELIAEIDRPRLAGAQIARIEPVYWPSDKLAQAVTQALQTEGFQATSVVSPNAQRAITFMPVAYSNQMIMFSSIPEAFERALFWVNELDRPAALGDQQGVFVYQVKNTSAEEVGRLASAVTGETAAVVATASNAAPAQAQTQGQNGQPAPQPQPQTGARGGVVQTGASGARITVDAGGNRILFRGTPTEFERARRTFEQLDTPPKQVLIEITIAEVTLNDETKLGIDWFAEKALANGFISGGTEGGVGLTVGGLTINYEHDTVRAALSAFATNSNVNILSTPRIVARSGGAARIQVGTDVPIITSQRAANVQQGGSTDVLQSVQYRQTGVILDVNPIVFGDRVDITLNQEVSSQQANPNAAIASPLILNRSVSTQISLQEGTTAVIGGLMQDNYTRGNTGVPLFKDLPLVGAAFRTDRAEKAKTELLLLVTPYVMRNDEMSELADSYRNQLNAQFMRRGPHAYTLIPYGIPFQGLGLFDGAAPVQSEPPLMHRPPMDEPPPSVPPDARATPPSAEPLALNAPAAAQPAGPSGAPSPAAIEPGVQTAILAAPGVAETMVADALTAQTAAATPALTTAPAGPTPAPQPPAPIDAVPVHAPGASDAPAMPPAMPYVTTAPALSSPPGGAGGAARAPASASAPAGLDFSAAVTPVVAPAVGVATPAIAVTVAD